MATAVAHYQIDVDQYTRMHEAGVFGLEERVELLNGEIRVMSPIGPTHASIVNRLTALLVPKLTKRAIVSIQNAFRLERLSMPQPDVAVARWRDDYYATKLPETEDVLLVIEVADSSLKYDRGEKLPRYAAAGVPETWIVNIPKRNIEQYSQPAPKGYRHKDIFGKKDTITSVSLPVLKLRIDDIVG